MDRSPRAQLLILDVDGVLYDYDRSERVRVLASLLGRTPDAVDDAVFASGIEDRADAGELTTEEYLAAVGDRLGCRLDRETWVQARIAATRPMAGELALMHEAASRARVATLSNNSVLLKEEMPRIMPELSGATDVDVHVAGEIGVLKPAAGAYLALTERYAVEPGQAAFVDDAERHVRGAERAGLLALRYTGLDGLRSWLVDLGVVEPA